MPVCCASMPALFCPVPDDIDEGSNTARWFRSREKKKARAKRFPRWKQYYAHGRCDRISRARTKAKVSSLALKWRLQGCYVFKLCLLKMPLFPFTFGCKPTGVDHLSLLF